MDQVKPGQRRYGHGIGDPKQLRFEQKTRGRWGNPNKNRPSALEILNSGDRLQNHIQSDVDERNTIHKDQGRITVRRKNSLEKFVSLIPYTNIAKVLR